MEEDEKNQKETEWAMLYHHSTFKKCQRTKFQSTWTLDENQKMSKYYTCKSQDYTCVSQNYICKSQDYTCKSQKYTCKSQSYTCKSQKSTCKYQNYTSFWLILAQKFKYLKKCDYFEKSGIQGETFLCDFLALWSSNLQSFLAGGEVPSEWPTMQTTRIFDPRHKSDSAAFLWGKDECGCRHNPDVLLLHSVWNSPKKSHSTLRAKRTTFTFWVDKS